METRCTRGAQRRQRSLKAAGVIAPPEVLGQLRQGACCGRREFERSRRQHAHRREGAAVQGRRRPQAVAGRKSGVEALGKPQTLLDVANRGRGDTASEAPQGQPGDGTRLDPTRGFDHGAGHPAYILPNKRTSGHTSGTGGKRCLRTLALFCMAPVANAVSHAADCRANLQVFCR